MARTWIKGRLTWRCITRFSCTDSCSYPGNLISAAFSERRVDFITALHSPGMWFLQTWTATISSMEWISIPAVAISPGLAAAETISSRRASSIWICALPSASTLAIALSFTLISNSSTCSIAIIPRRSMDCRPFRGPHQVLRTSRRSCRFSPAAKGKSEFVWSSRSMGHNRLRMSALLLLVNLLLFPTARGQVSAPQPPTVLRERLAKIATSFPGKVAIFVRNIETGEEAGVSPDEQFPMASTYKVAIMVQVFREAEAGHLSLTERVPLSEADRRLGSGLLPYVTSGLNPTIHDLVLLMITLSDNEATDLLLKRVGARNVTAMLRQLAIQDMRVD